MKPGLTNGKSGTQIHSFTFIRTDKNLIIYTDTMLYKLEAVVLSKPSILS